MGAPSQPVSIVRTSGPYPRAFPYDPDQGFPEYRGPVGPTGSNPVYRAVRESFFLLGLDRDRFDTPHWNPLGAIVRPGDMVFIKPNLATHQYGRKRDGRTGDLFSVITHPSVVRAVADYVGLALDGRGEICIGDNPTIDANFAGLMSATGLDGLPRVYRERFGLRCSVLDLRREWCDDLSVYGLHSRTKRLPGDPRGSTVVNLGRDSFLSGLNPLLFRGVFQDRWQTIRHHHGRTHEYSVSNSIYESDVFISIPKLKTHHKVGVTLNVKGLVGICAEKNLLVHWRIGYPSWGGDEYPDPARWSDHVRLALHHFLPKLDTGRRGRAPQATGGEADAGRVPAYRGAWEGNDTCWRMAADLYGVLQRRPRRSLAVIDGVTAGEGDGPFMPRARQANLLISSENLLLADCAAVRLMDFDLGRVKHLARLVERHGADLAALRTVGEGFEGDWLFASTEARYLEFAPPSGWPNLPLRSESPCG